MTERGAGSFSCGWDSSKSEIAGSAGKFLSEADRMAMHIADKVAEQADIEMKVIDVGWAEVFGPD
jgi:hypothetical protein